MDEQTRIAANILDSAAMEYNETVHRQIAEFPVTIAERFLPGLIQPDHLAPVFRHAYFLCVRPSQTVITWLEKGLTSPNPDLSLMCALMLAGQRHPAAKAVLIACANEGETDWQLVNALSKYGDKAVWAALRFLYDTRPTPRTLNKLFQMAHKLGDEGVIERVTRWDKEWNRRRTLTNFIDDCVEELFSLSAERRYQGAVALLEVKTHDTLTQEYHTEAVGFIPAEVVSRIMNELLMIHGANAYDSMHPCQNLAYFHNQHYLPWCQQHLTSDDAVLRYHGLLLAGEHGAEFALPGLLVMAEALPIPNPNRYARALCHFNAGQIIPILHSLLDTAELDAVSLNRIRQYALQGRYTALYERVKT